MRAGFSGLDLRKIDNWDETKEKSWKRICLPPMKLKLSPQVTKIIKKVITLANHNYEPYFVKPKDVPSEEEAVLEEISILKKYLPTRQTNIFVQNFEIELENDFNCPIQVKIIDLEFIQCEIMYPLSFVKTVSNYPKVFISISCMIFLTVFKMDELAHLQKWCYVQRKINSKILRIDSADLTNPIFAMEDMLMDFKDLILPQFWKQKNSPKVEVKNLYSAIKTIKFNISPKIKQTVIHTVLSLIHGQSKSILLNLNDEQISFWIDSMNISLVLENFMDINCLISSIFIDRIKAESGSVTSFVSDPEFINVKSQIPLSLDGTSQAQPIVIGNIKRFMMIIDPCFIKTLTEFKHHEPPLSPEKHRDSGHSNSQTESNSRQILKHAMNGLINLSIEKSTLSIKRDENELICDLPHGRLCTVGMSNLGMDLDMPTFISNPIGIGLINYPVSTQIIFSETKIISILNRQKDEILMVPSSSVSVSLNIPDSTLVPIMIIVSVDLASFELNFSKDQIEFILSLSETFEKNIRNSRNSVPELSESFCAKDFDQFEFSDVTSEVKNEATNQTEQRSIRSLTLTMALTQGQVKFISNDDILAIKTEDLKISLTDKQTHRQFKLSTTSFLIDINKETVLTTDGRGPTSFIGVDTSRCEPKYDKGFNLGMVFKSKLVVRLPNQSSLEIHT